MVRLRPPCLYMRSIHTVLAILLAVSLFFTKTHSTCLGEGSDAQNQDLGHSFIIYKVVVFSKYLQNFITHSIIFGIRLRSATHFQNKILFP